MRSPESFHHAARGKVAPERGSVLVVALAFAAAISLVLVSYLQLGQTTLKISHRTFFANDAANLAEAGLEEALYCFGLMGTGTAATTAWTGWTVSGTNAMRTLSPFNRDQNAVGIVKVHVTGYDGTNAAPVILSQAVITPFDGGAPIVKTVQVVLSHSSAMFGLVGINGVDLKKATIADSFNSNPTGSATGPWLGYTSALARANTSVVVLSGALSVGTGRIYGDVHLGAGATPPSTSEVSGAITTNFSATFPMPTYPTAAGVSQSYDVGASIPGTLPVTGHQPASDGRYYYFCANTTIATVAIAAGTNVTLVGTNTNLAAGLTVPGTSICDVFMDGTVTLARGSELNAASWAGALRVYTTTTDTCAINGAQMVACLYAPNAALTVTATGTSTGMMVGSFVAKTVAASGGVDFHYDEALLAGGAGMGWTVTRWLELQSAADRATVAALTGNYLD